MHASAEIFACGEVIGLYEEVPRSVAWQSYYFGSVHKDRKAA
jgi:hypothetical protein